MTLPSAQTQAKTPARLQPRPGLLPFAIAITVLNVLGHFWLGFEQAWLTPLVAVSVAYACELGTELAISGWTQARFRGGARRLMVFLLPAHITGLAVGMLLYTNERFVVVAFAVAVAIFSKVLLRVPLAHAPGASTHFMNPSNLGIAAALLLYSDWVSVAPPYQFTENVGAPLDWLLPLIIVCSGSFLNWRATRRLRLVLAWVGGFATQAMVRALFGEASAAALLAPMTGLAFVLFTFYMISDPVTTPATPAGQVAFGLATAAVYGLMSHAGIVFGLFLALCATCFGRGMLLLAAATWGAARTGRTAPAPAVDAKA